MWNECWVMLRYSLLLVVVILLCACAEPKRGIPFDMDGLGDDSLLIPKEFEPEDEQTGVSAGATDKESNPAEEQRDDKSLAASDSEDYADTTTKNTSEQTLTQNTTAGGPVDPVPVNAVSNAGSQDTQAIEQVAATATGVGSSAEAGAPQAPSENVADGPLLADPALDTSSINTSTSKSLTPAGSTENIDPEIIANDDTYVGQEDVALQNIDVLQNDIHTTGRALLVADFTQGEAGGNVNLNADGTLRYMPPRNYSGKDVFQYQVTDNNGLVASASVVVEIQEADDIPVARPDYVSLPGNADKLVKVLANDRGLGDGVVMNIVGPPQNGTARVVEGKILYKPNKGYTGTDSLIYRLTDKNGDVTTATVSLDVQCQANCQPELRLQLSWRESPSFNIKAYKLHIWDSAMNYLDIVNVGNKTQYEYILNNAGEFYFAVSAINARNIESTLSEVIHVVF